MIKIDENTKISELPETIFYLAAIGQICAGWQMIEQFMEQKIWKWAGLSRRRGICLTAHMGFPLRCDVFRSLAHLKFQNKNYDKSLNKFIANRLKPAKAVRDRFAHARWLQEIPDKFVILEKPIRLLPNLEKNEISAKEIAGGALKIVDTFMEFVILIQTMEGQKFDEKTWPQKFGPPFYGYDQFLAERSRHRAKPNKRPRPARSSRA